LLGTTPLPQHWTNFAIGRSGIWMAATVRPSKNNMTVMLLMDTKSSPVFFPQLKQQQDAIEQEFGKLLTWNDSSDLKQWRIEYTEDNVDFADQSRWQEYHQWIIDHLNRFDRVFRGRIQELDLAVGNAE
jgi:hypothetical protein